MKKSRLVRSGIPLLFLLAGIVSLIFPAGALGWSGGETQTQLNEYTLTVAGGETVPDTGVIHDQWVWQVTQASMTSVSLPCGPGLTGNFWEQQATITPVDYTWNWPVGNAACREAYAYGSASTAAIVSAILYADNTDGRALAQVSTQKLFGGSATNTAVVYYTYGGGYPGSSYTLTVQTQATLMGCTGWTDVFTVTSLGPQGTVNVPGCGDIQSVGWQWDWASRTNGNLPAGAQPPKTAAVTMKVPMVGLSLAPLEQTDSYHFVSTQTETCTGANPCPQSYATPTVSTSPASGVVYHAATLNGDLTDLGTAASVNVWFEWGLDTNYGHSTTPEAMTNPGGFYADISGLDDGTTYHFRAVADGDGDPVYGDDETFTTEVGLPPAVATDDADGITASKATLHGTLTDLGSASSVQVYFEFGLDTSYGSHTGLRAFTGPGAFSANLTGLTPDQTYHFRAVAVGDGVAYGDDNTFHTLYGDPPAVETDAATAVTAHTATLNGTLESMGTATEVDVYFTYGLDPSCGSTTAPQTMIDEGTFSANLSGLLPGTEYYFAAVAVGDYTVYAGTLSFTTDPPIPPVVLTEAASNVGVHTATLNGTLSSLGTAGEVQVYFEYGPDTNYGWSTSPQTLTATGAFTADISGLDGGTEYHFRAVAVGDGTETGYDTTFTTDPAVAPTASTLPATDVTEVSARLRGSLEDLGSASTVMISFEYGRTTSYGNSTSPQAASTPGAFSALVYGLAEGTTYHFRIKAVGDGITYGDDLTFRTPDAGGPIITPVYATPTSTPTPTPKPSPTRTPSPTPTPTPSPSPSPSPSPTPTPTPSPSPSPSPSPTPTPTPSPSPSPSPTPTLSPTASPTGTPGGGAGETPTGTPPSSPTPELTPSPTVEEGEDSGTNVPLVAGIAVAGAAAAGTFFFLAGKRRKKKSEPES